MGGEPHRAAPGLEDLLAQFADQEPALGFALQPILALEPQQQAEVEDLQDGGLASGVPAQGLQPAEKPLPGKVLAEMPQLEGNPLPGRPDRRVRGEDDLIHERAEGVLGVQDGGRVEASFGALAAESCQQALHLGREVLGPVRRGAVAHQDQEVEAFGQQRPGRGQGRVWEGRGQAGHGLQPQRNTAISSKLRGGRDWGT